MEWEVKLQKQGRIKLPQDYIRFKKLKEGNCLRLIEKRKGIMIQVHSDAKKKT